nr:LamG-like jellyroll fold domain-containing protein [Paenibacillus xylanexedens]
MGIYNPLYVQQLMNSYGVAWFKLNESTTTSIIDSMGSATAIVTGTTIVTGLSGNARSFTGTDKIVFNAPVIPIGKKSIRFKLKKNTNPASPEYLLWNAISPSERGIAVAIGTNGEVIFLLDNGSAEAFRATSTKKVTDGTWHDILCTWDGTTGANGVKLYIDDMVSPNAVATSTSTETSTQTRNLTISGHSETARRFSGTIDEIEIYNEVINPIANKFLISLENKYQSLSYDNRDLIPKMTSDTLPSGIASCSTTFSTSGAYNAFNAFDKTITQTGSFNSWVTASGQLTGWLAYEFPSATVVNKYTLVHGYNNVNVSPKSWTFEGTNDNGLTWTVLDQRSNITDWILWTEKEFEFVNLNRFKKYRINITANNGSASYVGIQEMKMYDTNRTLLFYPTLSEGNFIKHGLNKNELIETYKKMSKKSYISTTSNQIGSGKVFKQKVDTSKIPIKKALII